MRYPIRYDPFLSRTYSIVKRAVGEQRSRIQRQAIAIVISLSEEGRAPDSIFEPTSSTPTNGKDTCRATVNDWPARKNHE
jgi:hypothetical protein